MKEIENYGDRCRYVASSESGVFFFFGTTLDLVSDIDIDRDRPLTGVQEQLHKKGRRKQNQTEKTNKTKKKTT